MKKALNVALSLLLIGFASQSFSQAPQSFKYQSVARDASGNPMVSASIGLRISVRDLTSSGTVLYRETHTAATNEFGVFSISVGGGTVVSGTFSTIAWGTGAKFIEVEADFSGGTSYISMGASQLLSVPYALYSENGTPGTNGLNVLSGTVNPDAGIGVNGEFYINTSTHTLFGPKAGGAWPAGISLVGPAGLLTSGAVAGNTPYWNGTSWVVNNSNIFNNGGNVGIGTSTTAAKLDILGTIKITDGTQGAGKVLTSNATGLASWTTIGGGNMLSSNNLSDVANVATARTNLGLGSLATLSTVTSTEITNGTIVDADITSVDAAKITSGTLPVARGGSGITAVVPGAIAYGGASNFAFTAAGTAGQLLQSNGAGVPTWVNAPGAAWGLIGNSGTVDGTNFIGTTNNIAINFRVNNLKAGRIDPAGPVFLGYQAGNSNTGTSNIGIGYQTLYSNSTGLANTANGYQSLFANTTGSYNTSYGNKSLYSNTTGTENTANGDETLYFNTTGSYHTAIGLGALYSNTTADYNTANGYRTLFLNTTGTQNTANGFRALYSNTTGNYNTANGSQALYSNTTGYNNTATGMAAIYLNTTGYNNTANGFQTLYSNTTGRDNTANGNEALYYNTTGVLNTAHGSQALYLNTTGNSNTATGTASLYFNTTGSGNTANGYRSLYSNTTGSSNSANGLAALYSNTTGFNNTGTGGSALYSNTTGYNNTANGFQALYSNTDGNHNTANGYGALYSNTTGANNTALGSSAFSSGAAYSNSTAIGYLAQVSASNMVRIGNTAVTSINGAVAFTVVSDKRFKKDIQENVSGLPFIMKLRPVTYHLDMDKMARFMKTPDSLRIKESESAKEKVLQTGFIAQEVEKVAQEIGYDFSGIDKPVNEEGYYGLRYAEFTVPLVMAVQEQQHMIEKLKEEVELLKKQHQSVVGKLESENALLKSDYNSRLKKLEDMLGLKAEK